MLEIVEDKQTELIKERFSLMYPMVDEHHTPLPKCWNVKDKYRFLYLSNRNLRVHHKGLGDAQHDSGSIRATNHVPHTCGVYYFEIKIVDKGPNTTNIAIGLASRKSCMNFLPGWENTSYGYHGENGQKFHSSDNGKPYGPKYTIGDIIGCGINFVDRTCFFTINGHYLGVAFKNIPHCLYPTVGMQTKGEIIEANFGQEDFIFDTTFIKDELKARVKLSIENFPITDTNKNYKMILSYLIHHGYIESAIVFAKSTGQKINEDFQSIYNRQNIMNLIRLGKIDTAITLTNKLYPQLLKKKEELHFRLLCRQFIELFNETSESINYFGEDINTNLISNETIIEEKNMKIIKIIKLGQEIYKFNKKLTNSNDLNTRKMKEAFSLIAYNDPQNSNMKWLLESDQRQSICNELNSTILEYINRPPITALDLAPTVANDLLNFMAQTSNPTAVFINIGDYLREEVSVTLKQPIRYESSINI